MTLMTADDLACRELVELVTAYLEDALDSMVRQRFEEHLVECPYCQTYVEQIRITIELAGRVEVDHMSPQVRQRLVDAFRGWHTSDA